MRATQIDPGLWLVEQEDGRRRKVAVPAAQDTEAGALAILAEADAGPTAAQREAAVREAVRAECRRRILALCDETAQINLAAAAAAGLLSAADLATYQAGLGWVAQMRAAWSPMAEAGDDPADDGNWPAIPPGVAELAERF